MGTCPAPTLKRSSIACFPIDRDELRLRAPPGAVPLDRDDGAASVYGAQVISGKPPKETHSRQGFTPIATLNHSAEAAHILDTCPIRQTAKKLS